MVAEDSFFITLFVVILFHQMFEGLALGTRIASVGHHIRVEGDNLNQTTATGNKSSSSQEPEILDNGVSVEGSERWKSLSMAKKLLMAGAFALITPIGMAIGIGALQRFNGNDPSTLIALGTLDALSAGILVWVGVVEMWAGDWMPGGELAKAGVVVTVLAGFGLVAGMIVMSVLGKWT